MVTTPYQISGTVYDVDGSLTLNDATVKIRNLRTNETLVVTSDSNGEYLIDIANLSSGYRNNDIIFIETYLLLDTVQRYSSTTLTVNTSIGYTTQDITVSGINDNITITTRHEDIKQLVFNPISNKLKIDLPIGIATEAKQDDIISNSKSYTTLIDDYTVASKTFIGKAIAGSAEATGLWSIKCLDETGDYLKIQFADGVSGFSKIWNDRTTYSYS